MIAAEPLARALQFASNSKDRVSRVLTRTGTIMRVLIERLVNAAFTGRYYPAESPECAI